jgi:DNA-binding MarR family transcriptional regulator
VTGPLPAEGQSARLSSVAAHTSRRGSDHEVGPDDRSAAGAPDLHQLTGFLLRRAFVKAVGAAQACLTADAQLRDVLVLFILDQRGAMSQRSLGDVTGIHQTLIVELVDGLETSGWVARERNPADRRSNALRLTDAGALALGRLKAQLDRADSELINELTAAETARLKLLLHRLLEGDPSLDVPELSDRVGYLIARGHRSMLAKAEVSLRPLGLHPRDFGVLSLVCSDQPCSQRHLAQRLGVTPPAVLGFVDNLARAGLLRRTRKSGDRRSYDVTLTAAGVERLAQAREAAVALQAEVVRRLGPEGDCELRGLLQKILAT